MANALAFNSPQKPIPTAGTMPTPPPIQKPMTSMNALATASPYMPAPKKPQNAMFGRALEGFQRGFDPQGFEAQREQAKAQGVEKVKKTLALIQQQRAMPEDQRAQWWQQNAPVIGEIIGQDITSRPIDPSKFSDQELDGHIAALSAQLGQGPASPDYQFLQGPDGAISVGDKGAGTVRQIQPGAPKPRSPIIIGPNAYDPETHELVIQGEEKPPWVGAVKGSDGQWITDPNYIKGYRQMHPQQPGGASGAWVDVPAAEMEALGYPKGTIGQRNTTTRQLEVKARPSASQTGQPTEGERSAALHSSISMNGLRNIMQMEGGGYNRAGLGEQVSTFWGENEKLYDQAAAEFIDGYLRAMTGAAATATEIDTYRKQWFPQFGDNDKVIAQKSAGRLNALKSMKLKAGRAWNPEWDAVITSLEQGVSTPAASPQQQRAIVGEDPFGQPIYGNAPAQSGPQADDEIDPQIAAHIDSLFPDEDADGVPDGVTPEEWQHMTPEERALFQ